MKNNYTPASLLFAAIFCLYSFQGVSQVPGTINRIATSVAGRLILDPNSDGYTSILTSGFAGDDVANSEIPYIGVRSRATEPSSDLRRGPNHTFFAVAGVPIKKHAAFFKNSFLETPIRSI